MKWTNRKKQRPKEGDCRTVRRFLLLPKKIGDEWRWLETATWTEECIEVFGTTVRMKKRWGENAFETQKMSEMQAASKNNDCANCYYKRSDRKSSVCSGCKDWSNWKQN